MRLIGSAPSTLGALLALTACVPNLAAEPQRRPPTPTPSPRFSMPREDVDSRSEPPRTPDDADGPLVLPAPRPAWEAKPVPADARSVEDGSYVVTGGDTLGRIADRTGAPSEAIARINSLAPPYAVRAGQRLRIPGGRYHLVRGGHTGIAIARAYGVEWSRIVTANALAEPYTLRVGQRLVIPAASTGVSRAAERAAAFTLDVEDLVTGAQPAEVASARKTPATATPRRVLAATTPIVPPARLATGFLWPVEGRIVKRFGAGGTGERSDGIKIAVPLQTPIKAAADGVVAYVGNGIAALGGLVIVKHGDGWASVYGHAAKLLVRRGQSVKRGETIALSGETGFADRPELHFELRKGRAAVDPLRQLPRT